MVRSYTETRGAHMHMYMHMHMHMHMHMRMRMHMDSVRGLRALSLIHISEPTRPY